MCFAANNIIPCMKNGRLFPWAVWEWLKYDNKLGVWIIKQLLSSVITKCCDFSVSCRSNNYLPQPSASANNLSAHN